MITVTLASVPPGEYFTVDGSVFKRMRLMALNNTQIIESKSQTIINGGRKIICEVMNAEKGVCLLDADKKVLWRGAHIGTKGHTDVVSSNHLQ